METVAVRLKLSQATKKNKRFNFGEKMKEQRILTVKTSLGEYNIYIASDSIKRINEYISLSNTQKALIITDSGVPKEYAMAVAEKLPSSVVLTINQGESSKNIETLQLILRTMVDNNFTRSDCVVAVGGGVVGDLSGFAASIYMRGIDFYNIPTTLLSQVDSSVGGKTAIDFMGLKNIVGSFYPPKCVVIDPETLKTLPKRQISNGLAESVKMSLTNDEKLFELFETENIEENISEIIFRSLKIKSFVVENDEKENGLRRVLNFGHTLAHAIETANGMEKYYHGECVAIGMVPMCSESVRERLIPVLEKLSLPYEFSGEDTETIIKACSHDKKLIGKDIMVVYVPSVGNFELKKMPFAEYEEMIRKVLQ